MATLPNASAAVTVTCSLVPATNEVEPLTVNEATGAGDTRTDVVAGARRGLFATRDSLPAVSKARALKVWVPASAAVKV